MIYNRRKGKKDKKQCQQIHFTRRAAQRAGIDITQEKREKIIAKINAGDYIDHEKQSNTRSIYMLTFEQKLITIVYDRMRKELVTLLPMGEEYAIAVN